MTLDDQVVVLLDSKREKEKADKTKDSTSSQDLQGKQVVEAHTQKRRGTVAEHSLVPLAFKNSTLAGFMQLDPHELSGNLRVSKLEESHEHVIEDYEDGIIKRRELITAKRGVEMSERSNSTATDIFESRAELEGLMNEMEICGATEAQLVRVHKLAESNPGAAIEKAATWLRSHR